jgi:hypothetical protein
MGILGIFCLALAHGVAVHPARDHRLQGGGRARQLPPHPQRCGPVDNRLQSRHPGESMIAGGGCKLNVCRG